MESIVQNLIFQNDLTSLIHIESHSPSLYFSKCNKKLEEKLQRMADEMILSVASQQFDQIAQKEMMAKYDNCVQLLGHDNKLGPSMKGKVENMSHLTKFEGLEIIS